MATTIPGITDFIPQIQPYQPDLNFYSSVLQTKQSQYDAGYSKMSGLYSSILNSPMLRDDNNNRRDEFLKAIDQDIKKVSGMDLSKQEYVSAANTIFKPFYEDKNIIHDIAFTKNYQKELGRAESFRNCIDPDKCGGAYWEPGVQAMHFKADEYRNADNKDALSYSAPRYTPFVNVTEKAMAAAEASGLKIEVEHNEKGYNITDTNGVLLLGDSKHAGPLPQFLYGMFGQDQAVIDMFKTQAYVQRKTFAKQNAMNPEFGSEANAEAYYLNNYIKDAVPALEKNAAQASSMLDELALKRKILLEKGTPIKGSDEESSLQLLDALLENSGTVKAYHDNVINQIKSTPNAQDLKSLRERADGLVANTLMQGTLNSAAYTYAMGTAKREMKADPYALEKFKTSESIRAHRANAMGDLDIYFKKMAFAKEEGIGAYAPKEGKGTGVPDLNSLLRAQGIDPKTATPEQKAQALGTAIAGTNVPTNLGLGGKATETAYQNNGQIFKKAIEQVNTSRKSELANAIDIMKSKYGAFVQRGDSDNRAKADQIQKDLAVILQGTGINSADLLNGTKGIQEALNGKSEVAIAGGFGKMTGMMNDPTSLWGGEIKNSPNISKTILNQAAISEITKASSNFMNKAVSDVKTNYRAALERGDVSQEDYNKTEKIMDAMTTTGGLFVPQSKAAADYAKKRVAETLEKQDKAIASQIKAGMPLTSVTANYRPDPKALYKQYEAEFNNGYSDFRKAIEEKIPNLISPKEGETFGGAGAPLMASQWQVSSNTNAITDVLPNKLAGAVRSGNLGVVFEGKDLSNMENNPETAALVQNLFNQYTAQKGKAGDDLGFTMTETRVDKMDFGGKEVQPGVVYTVKPNAEAVKKILGKAYNPSKDYSYNIYYNDAQDPLETAKRDELSPVDVVLKMKGASLTAPLPGGNLTVTNNGKSLIMSGSYKYNNPFKNEVETKNFSDEAPLSSIPSLLMAQTTSTITSLVKDLQPKQ